MNYDELDGRLRLGLDAIARAAGQAPTYDAITGASRTSERSRSLPRAAAVAVFVLAVVVGGLSLLTRWTGDQRSDDVQTPTQLWSTWRLTQLNVNGRDLVIPSSVTPAWQFITNGSCNVENILPGCQPGPRIVGFDGCNSFERSISPIGEGTIHWGTYRLSTAVDCANEASRAMSNFMRADSFTYSTSGQGLVLTANGVQLVFVADESRGAVPAVSDEPRASLPISDLTNVTGASSVDSLATGP